MFVLYSTKASYQSTVSKALILVKNHKCVILGYFGPVAQREARDRLWFMPWSSCSKHSENSVFICLSALLMNSAADCLQGSSSVFTSFTQFWNKQKQVQKGKSPHGNSHFLLNEELIFIDPPTHTVFDLLISFYSTSTVQTYIQYLDKIDNLLSLLHSYPNMKSIFIFFLSSVEQF